MAEPETEKNTLLLQDCVRTLVLSSPFSKLQLSSSSSAKMAQLATKDHTLSISDWSLLPEVLLHIISTLLDSCMDIIHVRSVCSSWRSSLPFPSSLFSLLPPVPPSYSLPAFPDYPFKSKNLCTLEKTPLFLFRVRDPLVATVPSTSKYLLGGLSRDGLELRSPLQYKVKVKIPGSVPTLINMCDCEFLPLCHHQYRMIGWDPKECTTYYRGVAFLSLGKEGGGSEFVVIVNYFKVLLVLTSAEMRWKRLTNLPDYPCTDLVTFKGRFYAVFFTRKIVVIDPYTLTVTSLMPSPYKSLDYLIPSGDDELFLVEVTSRVSRLDEEAGKWVEVTDLGDRVLLIGELANVAYSVKELPDGFGVSGNSIVFTNGLGNVTAPKKTR